MKKIFNCISKLFILGFALFLVSCSDDDTELFDETPAVRITNEINELEALLVSQQQGYSGIYFPNNTSVGGVNFHMNFSANQRVKMTSDFKSDTSITDSRYEVSTGTTAAELVFTTGSRHINDLIQNSDPGIFFDSFFGNNVFQYVGEENGVITFREIRSRGIFVISPSGFTNFDTESVASSDITYANRQAFTDVDCATASVFNIFAMEINNSGETINYTLNYDSDNIFIDLETANAEVVSSSYGLGVAFTLIDGEPAITISPALEVGNNSFKDFILDSSAPGAQYVATVNGATARIFQTLMTTPTGDDVNLDLPTLGPTGYLYRLSLGNNALTSPCFQELVIDQINANLDAQFGDGVFVFTQFQFIFNFDSDNCDNYLLTQVTRVADGVAFTVFYCYNKSTISNNRLFQEYDEPYGTANAIVLEASFMPLIEFYNNPEATSQGMLYTGEGSFSSDTNSYINPAGTCTKMDDQALRVYGLFFG